MGSPSIHDGRGEHPKQGAVTVAVNDVEYAAVPLTPTVLRSGALLTKDINVGTGLGYAVKPLRQPLQ